MKISQCMKRNAISIRETATLREAAAVLVREHIGLLPVVDQNKTPVGLIRLRDLLALEFPDFINFAPDVDFVHDFGAVETSRPPASILDQTIENLMKPAISIQEDNGLFRAYALMLQQDLHDKLVVSVDRKLVGIASRVDIGTVIRSAWTRVV